MTRTPAGAHSAARDFVEPVHGCLRGVVRRGVCGRLTMIPDIDPMLTMLPLRRSTMRRPAACAHPPQHREVRVDHLVPLVIRHLEGGLVHAGAGVVDEDVDVVRPGTASSTTWSTPSRLVSSPRTTWATRSSDSTSLRTSSAAAASRPWMTTSAPASATAGERPSKASRRAGDQEGSQAGE